MKLPDAKSSALYSLAILVLSFAAATTLRALVLEFGADVFWGGIVAVSVLAGFGSALIWLKDANTWRSRAKWPEAIRDSAGFVLCSGFFFAVAYHVIKYEWPR